MHKKRVWQNRRLAWALAIIAGTSVGMRAVAYQWNLDQTNSVGYTSVPTNGSGYFSGPGYNYGYEYGGSGSFSNSFDNSSITTRANNVGVYANAYINPGILTNSVQSTALAYAKGIWNWSGPPGTSPQMMVTNVTFLSGAMRDFQGNVSDPSAGAYGWANGVVSTYAGGSPCSSTCTNYGWVTNYGSVSAGSLASGNVYTNNAKYTFSSLSPIYSTNNFTCGLTNYTISFTNMWVTTGAARITAATYIELDALVFTSNYSATNGYADVFAGDATNQITANGLTFVKFVPE